LIRIAAALSVLSLASPSQAKGSAFGDNRSNVQGVTPLDGANGDGVYGRFNGDMSARVLAGIEWAEDADPLRPSGELQVFLYQTGGAYVSYREGLGTDPIGRIASAGLIFSPLFLYRFSRAQFFGSAYPDLILDSLSLHAGAHLTFENSTSEATDVGFEWGAQLGVPILPRADGPWLRAKVNWRSQNGDTGEEAAFETSAILLLGWEFFFFAGLLND